MRKGDLSKRLGFLAEDQKSLVELAGLSGVPNDLKALIAQNPNLEELAQRLKSSHGWRLPMTSRYYLP